MANDRVNITFPPEDDNFYADLRAEVDAYFNEALMRSVLSVRIVHGKGTGALRRAVREVAKQYPGISGLRAEPQELGGDGVTVVEFA